MGKKVLFVCCGGLENGGIQSVIMSIVRSLHDSYDFDAIVFSKGDQHYTSEFLHYGCIYHFSSRMGNGALSRNVNELIRGMNWEREFAKFMKRHGPYDVIHCHNYFESAPFLKVASRTGIPVRVAHSHNVAAPYKRKNPLLRYLVQQEKKEIIKYATNCVACSKAAGEYLFNDAPVEVIHNAIDLDKFNPGKFDQYDGRLQFVHIGRYSKQKNQLFLLDVFKNILLRHPQATLKMIGFGAQEQEVRNKIINDHLDKHVTMFPHDTNVAEVLSQSCAMIFPSTYEGLGISLIEAQAMGVRCFVSEAIQPEADLGLCVHLQLSWGAEQWATYICDYIDKNGVEHQYVDMSSYDIKKIADQYRKLYG